MVNPCQNGTNTPCASGAKIEWGYPSVGQNVTGAGIAPGTTVTRVWPAQDIVFLSQATIGAETGGTSLTYADNPFGFGGAIGSIANCTHNPSDICLTVANTQDLVSGSSDIVVISSTTGVGGRYTSVTLGDGGANPGTVIDIPCASGMCGSCSGGGGSCGSFITGYMVLDADERLGDSVYLANSGGVQMENFQTFQHECGLHFATGSESDKAVNIQIDQYDSINDVLFCGTKFDGTAEGNTVANGQINAAGTDILSDVTAGSPPVGANTVENLTLGISQNTLAYQSIFEDEGASGVLSLSHNSAHGVAYALVADNIGNLNLTGNIMPRVDLYFQSSGSAQANTTGILNQFDSNTPNMAPMGNCPSTTTTSLAIPMTTCGFLGVPAASYPAQSSMAAARANPMPAMFDSVTGISGTLQDVAFSDSADGSGKCHWVINTSPTYQLNVHSASSADHINGGNSYPVPLNKMGIFCTSSSGVWWGGTLN
jgi:hypothetical protein